MKRKGSHKDRLNAVTIAQLTSPRAPDLLPEDALLAMYDQGRKAGVEAERQERAAILAKSDMSWHFRLAKAERVRYEAGYDAGYLDGYGDAESGKEARLAR